MKRDCNLVTPPSPRFLQVVIPRGVKVAASCLESISFKPIDSKGVGKGEREGFEEVISQTTWVIVTQAVSYCQG